MKVLSFSPTRQSGTYNEIMERLTILLTQVKRGGGITSYGKN